MDLWFKFFGIKCTSLYVFFFQAPNVGEELTGGCKGFATEFMQWAEELIVGGTEKKNGTLTRWAFQFGLRPPQARKHCCGNIVSKNVSWVCKRGGIIVSLPQKPRNMSLKTNVCACFCCCFPRCMEKVPYVDKTELAYTLFFFYRNRFFKNVEPEIDPDFKNILMTYPCWD